MLCDLLTHCYAHSGYAPLTHAHLFDLLSIGIEDKSWQIIFVLCQWSYLEWESLEFIELDMNGHNLVWPVQCLEKGIMNGVLQLRL